MLLVALQDIKALLRLSGVCPESGNQKEIFLWAYSLFMVGEKRKEEEMCEVAGKHFCREPTCFDKLLCL